MKQEHKTVVDALLHLADVIQSPDDVPELCLREAAALIEELSSQAAGAPSNTMHKTLHNSDVSGARRNVPDISVVGDGDMFRLLCKASSKREGWMKSTKAMEVAGGCVVQVTTQQGDHVAEALTFVPGVKIADDKNNGRKLIAASPRASQ